MYVAACVVERISRSRFQTGPVRALMFAWHDGHAPTNNVSDMRAGWVGGATRAFATETPKFIMGGVAPELSSNGLMDPGR